MEFSAKQIAEYIQGTIVEMKMPLYTLLLK